MKEHGSAGWQSYSVGIPKREQRGCESLQRVRSVHVSEAFHCLSGRVMIGLVYACPPLDILYSGSGRFSLPERTQ